MSRAGGFVSRSTTAGPAKIGNNTHVTTRVPEEIRPLLGPSWTIKGEHPELFEELLGLVGDAVKPKDIIDWLLVGSIVQLTWEIQRTNRHRESIVRTSRQEAMQALLDWVIQKRDIEDFEFDGDSYFSPTSELSQRWMSGNKAAAKKVEKLLSDGGYSIEDVDFLSLTLKAKEFEQLDLQNERHERRRDSILQQIERRRAGWSQFVKNRADDIIDAEYVRRAPSADRQPID
jgi:hypothetical protein